MLHHSARSDGDGAAQKLEIAITRNAHLIVVLRHTVHALHLAGDHGHQRSRRWVQCTHKDCRRAAELLGEAEGTV